MAELLGNLSKYGVSHNSGFVPELYSQPLDAHYQAWEDIAANLPKLLHEQALIQRVESTPNIELQRLRHESDWQRAYVLLAFIIHGLVHGCRQANITSNIADPFLQICEHIGVEPVLSYAGLCLFNCAKSDKSNVLGGMRSIVTFTGTIDEEAFYLVPVLIELEGGKLPSKLLSAHMAAQNGSWQEVSAYLDDCYDALTCMVTALEELSLCRPHTFYHDIRPYIASLEIEFERTSARPLPVKLVGGSAGQASLFQFLDHMLAVKHETMMLREMRAYMPRGHRRFLDDVETLPSLQDIAVASNVVKEVFDRLDQCRKALKAWRDKHIAIVTRYIMLPAQAAARNAGQKQGSVKGTAGSSPVTFLKQIRDETLSVQP